MIKLYTDVAGKELLEEWKTQFGAWTEENRDNHEYEGETFYCFMIPEGLATKVTWQDDEDADWYEYDYVIDENAVIDFIPVKGF